MSCCVLCVWCCVCGAAVRGAQSAIRAAAFRSRQGWAPSRRTHVHPDGGCFVAGRGWVLSGRALVHPDSGCSVAGTGWVCCRACTRPSGRRLVLLGTCSRAVVCRVLCTLSGFSAPSGRCGLAPRRASLACLLAPRGAPRLVPSGRSGCSGRLSRRRGAFPHPGGLRRRLCCVAAQGTRRPAENWARGDCCWRPPRQGRWARSASYPFGAP